MSTSLNNAIRFLLGAALILAASGSFAAPHNGFDLSDSLIDKGRIFVGGPAKDGIPSIDKPTFIHPNDADFLQPDDRILGIQLNGVSKAYPIAILNWHEIVNDRIKGKPFAITYCPLCGTGVAFSSLIDGKTMNFGVSGLLYNSDVLLYDRESESLWSQILGQAISGKHKGRKLEKLAITHTTWSAWSASNPQTLVLSNDTGYARDYERNPYSGYDKSRSLYFQVSNRAPTEFHPKERVLGLQVGDQFKAYPFSEIDKADRALISDKFAGRIFDIHWDRENQHAFITNSAGKQVAAIEGFWFAWYAFHPDTEVFSVSR